MRLDLNFEQRQYFTGLQQLLTCLRPAERKYMGKRQFLFEITLNWYLRHTKVPNCHSQIFGGSFRAYNITANKSLKEWRHLYNIPETFVNPSQSFSFCQFSESPKLNQDRLEMGTRRLWQLK